MALPQQTFHYFSLFSRSVLNLFSPLMDPFLAFHQSPIKGIFFIHFLLITCSMIIANWLPQIFFTYNLLFFILLLWGIQNKENPEPIQLAAVLNLLAIFFDVILITVNFGHSHYQIGFGFSFFLLICNVISRPFTSFILLRNYNERDIRITMYGNSYGSSAATTGSGIANRDSFNRPSNRYQSDYQDLDRHVNDQPATNFDSNQIKAQPTSTSTPYQSVPDPIPHLIDTK